MAKYYIKIIKAGHTAWDRGFSITGVNADVYDVITTKKVDANVFISCIPASKYVNFEEGKRYKVWMCKEGDMYVLLEYIGQIPEDMWKLQKEAAK